MERKGKRKTDCRKDGAGREKASKNKEVGIEKWKS